MTCIASRGAGEGVKKDVDHQRLVLDGKKCLTTRQRCRAELSEFEEAKKV